MTAWWACAEPERPTDASVLWHYEGCRACQIKADVLVQWLRQTIGGEVDGL